MTLEPADALPIGHYAVGVSSEGETVDIYRASLSLLVDVATGLPVVSLMGWHRRLKPEGRPEPT
jgi:hypothetical protein